MYFSQLLFNLIPAFFILGSVRIKKIYLLEFYLKTNKHTIESAGEDEEPLGLSSITSRKKKMVHSL